MDVTAVYVRVSTEDRFGKAQAHCYRKTWPPLVHAADAATQIAEGIIRDTVILHGDRVSIQYI